jgi:hypothetical protein
MAEQLRIYTVESCTIEFCVRLGKCGSEILQLIYQTIRRYETMKSELRARSDEEL